MQKKVIVSGMEAIVVDTVAFLLLFFARHEEIVISTILQKPPVSRPQSSNIETGTIFSS